MYQYRYKELAMMSLYRNPPRGAENPLLHQITQHVGAVRSLDVNPFQPNLLASGASESEIFIWDLNNPSAAMTPGNKMHPLEDISGVAWNRQVSGQGGREGGGGVANVFCG